MMVISILRSVRACIGVVPTLSSSPLRIGILQLFLMLAFAATAHAQPAFTKTFSPSTIGPGSVSTLTFTITEVDGNTTTDLAFTDTLPAGVTLATPANGVSTCEGTLVAADGGGTIMFNGGRVGANLGCSITVDVTSSVPGEGPYTNVSGDLTSSTGNSGTASAALTVATDRPGFTKSFSPNPIEVGGRSTLTFTIDNTANPSPAPNLAFTDTLPTGLEIASPANASTTCTSSTLTAAVGTSVITFSSSGIVAASSCTVSVDVTATATGILNNITGELTLNGVSSGKASAPLTVSVPGRISLVKSFLNDPVAPGQTVTLEFTIMNSDRNFSATNITFTDDFAAVGSGLVLSGLPMSNVCGMGSMLTAAGSVITLSGGTLAVEASCTFSISLMVPAGAGIGTSINTTSTITADINGTMETGAPATDTLFVEPVPILTKMFIDDPVNAGGTVTLEFTITNTSTTSAATNIIFSDNIGAVASGITIPTLPAPGFCGAGSTSSTTVVIDELIFNITGGNLAAGASCTFSVTLQVASDVAAGTYPNTTREITATVDSATRTGQPATDNLVVISAPTISKSFSNDSVAPGGTVTLEFTLTHDGNSATDATNITFTDDLNAALNGLASTSGTLTDICGTGSQIMGTISLTFTGGTLAPGASCTFSVTLQVPAMATPGTITNTTSNSMATVSGITATGNAATDVLVVSGLTFSMSFTDDPVIAGDTVTLEFALDNASSALGATDIQFTHNLNSTLSGLAATVLPMNGFCGAGSQITGTTNLTFSGGSLTPGTSCTFSITLQVPVSAADGRLASATSDLSATVNGNNTVTPAATDSLSISSSLLLLSKSFTDDPVAPGSTVTLEFTLSNLDTTDAASAIAFTDDLDAALSGLTFDSVLLDTCGGTVSGTSTDTITVSGASLTAGGTCTIRVSLSVPGAAAANIYTNTTSAVSGMIGGFAVSGTAASDNLEVLNLLLFSKSFDGPTTATGMATLTFSITNPGANTATGISFSDDLNAVIMGLIATSLPALPCGVGSSLTGISFLTFTGGELPPMGGMCSFDVDVLVPTTATAGTFPNTTSDLLQNGLRVAEPATADLVIEPPPTFAKVFTPDTILAGGGSTLTFTIDNSASALAASSLAFIDNLPASVVVALIPNVSTTCAGGTITANAGTSVISYSGGTVGAGATCTVQTDVVGIVDGAYVNTTGDLTSSSGNSGTASDTLTVNPAADLSVTKTDGVTSATPGQSVTYTIVVSNAGPSADPALTLSDTFPSPPLTCTYTSVAAGGATGNTAAGSGDLVETLSMPSGSSVTYTASCTIDSDATGTLSNTASITPSITDTTPGNNSATDGDTVLLGMIVIIKQANPEGATSFDFSTSGTGLSNFSLIDDGTVSNTQTFSTLSPGTFEITETVPAGWQLTDLSCVSTSTSSMIVNDPANAKTTITLVAEESVTCTFTDTQEASITVIKAANPEGSTSFPFTATGTGLSDFSLVDDGTAANTETFMNLLPGSFEITETVPAGWQLTNLNCVSNGTGTSAMEDAINARASISLSAGGNVTCTYTDTQEGSITVIKAANPGSSTSFAFTTTGTGLADFSLVDDGTAAKTQTFMNLLPGTFEITESVPTGWQLTGLSCVSNGPGTSALEDAATATATITLAATGSVTCTFTDTQNDSITIIKEANPEGATAFDFIASGTGLADFSLMDNGTGSNTQTFSNLLPGTFIITETIPTGWTLTDLRCVSNGTGTSAGTAVPNAQATITLAATGSVTCTFTDTQSPTPIPTLPQWGLLLLTLSLLTLATWQLVGQPAGIGHAGAGAAVLVSASPDWLSSLLLGQGVAIIGLLLSALFSPLVPHDGVGTLVAGLLLGVMIEAYHRSQ